MNKKHTVLVADDDEAYAKKLCSRINLQDGFSSAGYALNGAEALEMTMLTRPDAIILDILMPVLDGTAFLRRLSSYGLKKRPVVIAMSQTYIPHLASSSALRDADYFMVKPQSCTTICEMIRDLISLPDKSIPSNKAQDPIESPERRVSIFIRNLGIPAHLDGYKYIRDAIMLTTADMSLLTPITKKLYPLIAERYGTTKSCVERAIRHAISVSWLRGNKNMFNDVFGYSCDDAARRPTNSEYIAMAADDFRLRCKYGVNLP